MAVFFVGFLLLFFLVGVDLEGDLDAFAFGGGFEDRADAEAVKPLRPMSSATSEESSTNLKRRRLGPSWATRN